MQPTISDGSVKVFIKKQPRDNDIVLAIHNRREVVKRYKDDKLIGDNVSRAHNINNNFKIIGVLWPKK